MSQPIRVSRSPALAAALLLLPACQGPVDSAAPARAWHGGRSSLPADILGINTAADGRPGGGAVAALGTGWVRMELVDGKTDLPRAVDDHHGAGRKVLLVVDYSSAPGFPGWSNSGPCAGGDGGDVFRARYLDRLGGAAASGVDAIEIWNEEDHPRDCASSYNPGLPPEVFGPLLRDAYAVVRARTAVPVVIGGLDQGDPGYLLSARDAASGLYADAVATHPYGLLPRADFCDEQAGKGRHCDDLNPAWGTLGGHLDNLAAATGKPVWVTEFGIRTADTGLAADYLEAAYETLAGRGVVHGFFFCYSDAMVAPFGLTDLSWQPKPDVHDRYHALASGDAGGECPRTADLHGAVFTGSPDAPRFLDGVLVSAWQKPSGPLRETRTAGGIYELRGLDPSAEYNLVVNARYDGGWRVDDPGHAFNEADDVRNIVRLCNGGDGWHGEDFKLAY